MAAVGRSAVEWDPQQIVLIVIISVQRLPDEGAHYWIVYP
jgi:hypothetical protein